MQQGNTFSQARVQSYVRTATTPVVLQPAIDALGLDTTPAALAQQIQASAALNTVLINISATDESPVQAAALAHAVSNSLIDAVEKLETSSASETSPVRLSVITPAIAPSMPSSPNVSRNLVLGFLSGAVLGLGAAFLRTKLDTKIRADSHLRKLTEAPVLGTVAFDEAAERKPLLTQAAHQSPRAESFRQIRTNLQFANIDSDSKSMLVTSSLPGEGKSTTATNMAIAMSQAGYKVALVDADLRRPMIASYLGLESNAGLTTALMGAASPEDLMQPWGDDELYVLTSGQIPPNPSELLGSRAMSELLNSLESTFDAVIVDAPPLIPVTDATVLSQKVGGVVVVVGAGKVNTHDLEKSLRSLELVSSNVLGIVMNFLPTKGPDAYAYSYYSYASQPGASGKNDVPSRKGLNGSHLSAPPRGRRGRLRRRSIVR